ncbi:MAG: phosphoribosylanthranilate isomerase [Planctomycetia bacterium]|nr:phosphoribosylanthranilate isomerase [Planctomycetia bacterium]
MKYEIKICGLTRAEDVLLAARAGASFVGFVHVPTSPRFVSKEQIKSLFESVPDSIKKVCVVQNLPLDDAKQLVRTLRPDVIQLHGSESPDYARALAEGCQTVVWKALHLRSSADVAAAADFPADRIVADAAQGGSGQTCDWTLVRELAHKKDVMLAGGINPSNARDALRDTNARGLDICSGVESAPGIKSIEKIAAFFESLSFLKTA